MERENDVQLIRRILSGDTAAFSTLVRKHQSSVHTFVCRKIGDFHYAEEITQDTFLIVHYKLATLKDPHRFSGWLYRIAARQCLLWQRKKRVQTESLENANVRLIEKITYSEYIAEEQAKAATEVQRDIVERLLAQLPKGERTVVTLHYFQEMTCKEISLFLGVSVGTVKSSLHRARCRLMRAQPTL